MLGTQTMRRWLACAAALSMLSMIGCGDPYRGAYRPSPYSAASFDQQSAGCETMAANEAVVCEAVLPQARAAQAFEMRRQWETHASGCPAYAHQGSMGRLEQCVLRMEAKAAAEDPAGEQRRSEAKARAAATREAPAFKAIIASWFQALDRKNITCRDKRLSESNRRECERAHGDMRAVEDQLSDYLVAEGYDKRDFQILGLWPHDREWRISPN